MQCLGNGRPWAKAAEACAPDCKTPNDERTFAHPYSVSIFKGAIDSTGRGVNDKGTGTAAKGYSGSPPIRRETSCEHDTLVKLNHIYRENGHTREWTWIELYIRHVPLLCSPCYVLNYPKKYELK